MAFTNFAELIAQYNSSLPTLSDGQASPLQVDSNGRLLVQADVTVVLSHTNDSVQIGDGTDLLAVNTDGSINVTVNNTSIAVTATNLDIRDLSAAQDNVAISDGTDTLAINADGSINVIIGGGGSEADFASDPTGDGRITINNSTAFLLAQQAVNAGQEYKIHAWSWAADIQGTFSLQVRDSGVLVEVIRLALNAGSNPTGYMHFPRPIEISGAAGREVRVYFTRAENKNGSAHAAVNGELIV